LVHPGPTIAFRQINLTDVCDREAILRFHRQHGGEWLRELIATRAGDEVKVVGPAPCPIERIKSRWRWHVLLKSEHPGELTRVSRYFMERFDVPTTAQLRVTLDRDPVALL